VNVFLARQPIYDASRRIHGYELLFRETDSQFADVKDGTAASAQVMLNAAADIGVEKLAAKEPLFLNCTREFLMLEPFIPPDRCVLEILGDVDADAELLERIRSLRQRGYRIALDDFSLGGKLAAALPLADYIKLDVLALSDADLKRHVGVRRPGLLLVAKKVDSEECMERCRSLGFDLYQGYFLRHPETMKGEIIPTGKMAALRLITACQDPDSTVEDIAAAVSSDVSMTYSLLRLANSALFGRSRPIRSVQAVVTWMGTEYLGRWATLISLASGRGCPLTYLGTALQRGYMCEALAVARGGEKGGSSFLVGLLSTLDAILEVPMPRIMEQIRVTDEIRQALEERGGELGRLLAFTLAYEAGDTKTLEQSGIDPDLLRDAYWHAIEQAETTLQELAVLA
jgi:EAL and modified HD-GYP domain-containing signal transduction protein